MTAKITVPFVIVAVVPFACITCPAKEPTSKLTRSRYQGWNTQCLSNGLVKVHIVPEIGGRIVQLEAGTKEFLWVNPELAGKVSPPSGLAHDGGWLNYGGDKLWPAPQGWDNEQQWPGPPDAVLDGQPHSFEVLPDVPGQKAVRLTSRKDPRSGIQLARVIRIFDGSTRVAFETSMRNVDTRPRRWGIWAHTQLDAAAPDRSEPNHRMKAWCPINPQSRFLGGYHVLFGAQGNPSFSADWRRGLVEVNYGYEVGKIGVDSDAGWSATVDGTNGMVFVQRFAFESQRAYPDNASVEFWLNGVGKIHAYHRDIELPDDPQSNPFVFESELLSPYCKLEPGDTYHWSYAWYVANVGGDFRVVSCNEAGVTAAPLTVVAWSEQEPSRFRLTGRFGVFSPGSASLRFVDKDGSELKRDQLENELSPWKAFVLDTALSVPAEAKIVELVVVDDQTRTPRVLAQADLSRDTVPGQWSKEKAWQWYNDQPWRVGCNFLPSSAVNDVEMWEAGTFDAATIDRELGWARKIGFNTARVFLNFVVWNSSHDGFKARFARFLEIADRHQIRVMPVLFDDCNFGHRIAKAGKQPDPVPGVHNSQWVSSPPLAMVADRAAWPKLKQYTKDLLCTFGRDRRIVVWDLYNEPGNSNMSDKSLPLVEAVCRWARAARPTQPLTIGPWDNLDSRFSRRLMQLSDVVSFHGYEPLQGVKRKLGICREYDRPILCTEWLHRQGGNTVTSILPTLQVQRVGCCNWGLVFGRTQTYMPWGSKPGDSVPDLWQHDLFRPDGSPFRSAELDLIRELVQKSKRPKPAR